MPRFTSEKSLKKGTYVLGVATASIFGSLYAVVETLFLFFTFYMFSSIFSKKDDEESKRESFFSIQSLLIAVSLVFYLFARTRSAYQTIKSATRVNKLIENLPSNTKPPSKLNVGLNFCDTFVLRGIFGTLGSIEAVLANFAASAEKLDGLGAPLPVSILVPALFAGLSAPSQFFLLAGNMTRNQSGKGMSAMLPSIFACSKNEDPEQAHLIENSENQKSRNKVFNKLKFLFGSPIARYLIVWISAFSYSAGNTFMYWNRIWNFVDVDLEKFLDVIGSVKSIIQIITIFGLILPLCVGTTIAYGQVGEKFCGLLPKEGVGLEKMTVLQEDEPSCFERINFHLWWDKIKTWSAYITAPSSIIAKMIAIGVGLYHLFYDPDKFDASFTLSFILATLGSLAVAPYQAAFYIKPVEKDKESEKSVSSESPVPLRFHQQQIF